MEKEAFRSYTLADDKKEKQDIVSLRLNPQERKELEEIKRLIQQPKDATAIKTLAFEIGINVLHGKSPYDVCLLLFKNRLRNMRTGVPIEEPDFERM